MTRSTPYESGRVLWDAGRHTPPMMDNALLEGLMGDASRMLSRIDPEWGREAASRLLERSDLDRMDHSTHPYDRSQWHVWALWALEHSGYPVEGAPGAWVSPDGLANVRLDSVDDEPALPAALMAWPMVRVWYGPAPGLPYLFKLVRTVG